MSSSAQKVIRKVISTSKAPSPFGAYSQAVKVGNTMYLSGNIGVEPTTKEFVGPEIESQTRQVMKNIQAILEEAGMDFSNVVKTTMLLEDLNDFAKANEVYSSFLKPPYPARAAYQVAKLPMLAKIEIEAIAVEFEDQKN